MPDKVSKDGQKLIVTEFEVREIDEHGDAMDVDHYQTKEEALTQAQKCLDAKTCAAVVVEKHVKKYPPHMFSKPNVYTILQTLGSKEALEAGGWLK